MIRTRNFKTIILICTIGLLIFSHTTNLKAQPTEKPSLYKIQKDFNLKWQGKDISKREVTKGKGWKQYKRWENFMESRVYPSGKFPDAGILWNEATETGLFTQAKSPLNTWQQVGPFGAAGNINNKNEIMGAERVDCIAFHPTDPNTYYIGTPSGGVWKTINNGINWVCITNSLPTSAISDIEIDNQNPDILYIATGDRDSWSENENQQFGGYSVGILKSTDGGNTWQLTGLNYKLIDNLMVNDILLNSENPNIVTAATNLGIYNSTDAGLTWTKASKGDNVKDLKQHPTNATIIYAATANSFGYAKILKSTNSGVSFSDIQNTGIKDAGRIELAVTPANPDALFALITNYLNDGFGGLYKSDDKAATWSEITNAKPINLFDWDFYGSGTGGQGSYDITLAIDPENDSIIRVGTINIWRSDNGGNTWNIESYWNKIDGTDYVHADQHVMEYNPLNNNLFAGNDGGIYQYDNPDARWIDNTGDLSILQVYRLGLSATNNELLITGNQDNGSYKRSENNEWQYILGGDGMECVVDYTDENIIYAEYYYGNITRSTDGGKTYVNISPTYGYAAWITPYVIHPVNPQILYLGGHSQIFKTENRGDTWTVTANLGTNPIQSLAISKSNPDYIYAASYSNIWISQNGGTDFTEITNGLPSASITYIAVSDTDPNKIWISLSGYMANQKVYFSDNAGQTWQNYSEGLPNVPTNCIVHRNETDGEVYLATDLGVFFRNNALPRWVPYNNGLPLMIINELEIQHGTNKLYAATYGRGIWQSGLYNAPETDLGVVAMSSPISGTDITSTENVKVKVYNYGTQTVNSFKLWYQINNNTPVGEIITAEIKPGEFYEYQFTQVADLSESGLFNLKVYSELLNDANAENNEFISEIRNYHSNQNPEMGSYALNFRGQNHYVDCGNNEILNIKGDFTLEAWINPLNWGEVDGAGYGRIIDKKNFNVLLNGYGFNYNLQSLLVIITTDSGTVVANSPKGSIKLDEWQHIAVVYDAQKAVRIYINGLEQEVTLIESDFGPISDNVESKLIFGENRTLTRSFNGMIDEIRLWNIQRSLSDIRLNSCQINPLTTGLAGYWRFNEGPGSIIATDISGNSNHGYLENFNSAIGTDSDWKNEYHDCYPINLSVESINNPITDNSLTNSEIISLTLRNKGNTPVSDFEIKYTINNGTPVSETFSVLIEPSTEKEISFTVPADLSVKQMYTIQAEVVCTNDQVTSDNMVTKYVANNQYCKSFGEETEQKAHIYRVSFAGQDFISNYNGHSINPSPINIHLNKDYTVEIVPIGTAENRNCLLAIDWNADSDFEDENELYTTELNKGKYYTTFQGNKNGFLGNTILRVVYVLNDTTVKTVCGTFAEGETEDYTINTIEPLSDMAEITNFTVENQLGETAYNNETGNITVYMPKQSELYNIIANFTLSEKAKAFVNGAEVISGVSLLDFSYPLEFAVLAEDETHWKYYTITVRYELNDQSDFVSFAMPGQITVCRINKTTNEITAYLETGVNITTLAPQFKLSSGAVAYVDGNEQFTGQSINNFSTNVVYEVVSENKANTSNWTVKVTDLVGISTKKTENIKLFPNPGNEYVIIENAENSNLEIISIDGKIIHTEITKSNSHYVNLSNIPSGQYIVRISNPKYNVNFKILIAK